MNCPKCGDAMNPGSSICAPCEYERELRREYRQRPEVKERLRKYEREYRQRPEVKERQREYKREYRRRKRNQPVTI